MCSWPAGQAEQDWTELKPPCYSCNNKHVTCEYNQQATTAVIPRANTESWSWTSTARKSSGLNCNVWIVPGWKFQLDQNFSLWLNNDILPPSAVLCFYCFKCASSLNWKVGPNPVLPQSACGSVHGQDTEPTGAKDGLNDWYTRIWIGEYIS